MSNATPPAPRRRGPLILALLALAAAGGAAAYFIVTQSRPARYADPKDYFSADFPSTPTTTTTATANPMLLIWGESATKAKSGGKEYAVVVQDGLNSGDQEYGPATRDAQTNSVLTLAATNLNGDIALDRAATHEGHIAREVVLVGRGDGKLVAVRQVVGEKAGVRMTVTGSGGKPQAEAFLNAAGEFFGKVRLGAAFGPPVLEEPTAVTAADLAAAYKADAAAADAKYKGKWVRLTGTVTAAGDNTFEMNTLAARRAARGRLSPRVKAGMSVTATGYCEGMADGKIVVTEAVVARPKAAEPKE